MTITDIPQIIIAGDDSFGVLADLPIDRVEEHRFRVSQELLTAKRLAKGWTPEACAEACVIEFPDADPTDVPVLQARIQLLDVLISKRTGVRRRTIA